MVAWTLVAGLLAAALADEPAFVQAVELYKGFEYEQALLRFERLSIDAGRPDDERVALLLWTGICAAELGQDERARSSFDEALARDPRAPLPVSVSPKIEALFATARAQAQARPPTTTTATAATGTPPPDTGSAAAESAGGVPWAIIGIGTLGVSAAALVGGAVLFALTADALGRAHDPEGFQDDKLVANDQANALAAGGTVAVVGGVAAAALGAVALWVGLAE